MTGPEAPPGPLALVGGDEWTPACEFDAELWEGAGRPEILVLPTGAAYEHPDRAVAAAVAHFAGFGAPARGLDVLARADAEDPGLARQVAEARFVYLSGSSPLHLRAVLKDSAVWAALVAAWHSGAVVAGSSGGAMVLGDPMVDPRGGALTLGLGLLPRVAVVPHTDAWSVEKEHRTTSLATDDLRIVAIDRATALLRAPDGRWRVSGSGAVTVYAHGQPVGLDALPS